MHISYNGFIAPYTFQCPRSFFFKNIQKVLIAKSEEELNAEKEPSRRVRGIQLHNDVAAYLKHEIDEFPYITDTIAFFHDLPQGEVQIEVQDFFDTGFNPIPCKPEGDYVSSRIDCAWTGPTKVLIADWKFANPDYGLTRYRDELEFFLVGQSAKHPEIGEWQLVLHFPENDYTVPLPTYGYNSVARLQQNFLSRIDIIMEDKFYRPIPSQFRCGFCPYRSHDSGGSGHCKFTVV
jgi:hypothetical protein